MNILVKLPKVLVSKSRVINTVTHTYCVAQKCCPFSYIAICLMDKATWTHSSIYEGCNGYPGYSLYNLYICFNILIILIFVYSLSLP